MFEWIKVSGEKLCTERVFSIEPPRHAALDIGVQNNNQPDMTSVKVFSCCLCTCVCLCVRVCVCVYVCVSERQREHFSFYHSSLSSFPPVTSIDLATNTISLCLPSQGRGKQRGNQQVQKFIKMKNSCHCISFLEEEELLHACFFLFSMCGSVFCNGTWVAGIVHWLADALMFVIVVTS